MLLEEKYNIITHNAQHVHTFSIWLNACTSEKRACKPRMWHSWHSSLHTISAPVHQLVKLRKETESAKTRKKSQKPACGSKTRIPTSSSEWEGWEQRNGYGGKAWSKLSHTVQQNYRNHNCAWSLTRLNRITQNRSRILPNWSYLVKSVALRRINPVRRVFVESTSTQIRSRTRHIDTQSIARR